MARPRPPGPIPLGGFSLQAVAQLPGEASPLIPEGRMGGVTPAWHRALAGLAQCVEEGGPVMEFSIWVCSLCQSWAPTPNSSFSHVH